MKDNLKTLAGFLLLFALLGFAVWWQAYRWHDCRRVGHTFFYCLMTANH